MGSWSFGFAVCLKHRLHEGKQLLGLSATIGLGQHSAQARFAIQ